MAELIVALDFDDAMEAITMASTLRGHVNWVKVGLELFITEGPRIIHSLKRLGFNVFLDLKLHDIPNTVRGATLACVTAQADLLTVHISGGHKMCSAALEAVSSSSQQLMVFGVTVLTSLEQGEVPGIDMPLDELAQRMAADAAAWGLHGIVCSGLEVAHIKQQNPDLKCLTPGIRLGGHVDDQKRVVTPAQAVQYGADFLVVGRPVTRAQDPAAAAGQIIADMRAAYSSQVNI